MALAQYTRLIRTQGLLILVLTAVGGTVAFAYSATRTPMYSTSVQLFVSTNSTSADSGQLNQGGTFTQQRVKSYVDIVNSPKVTQAVINHLRLPYTSQELASKITTTNPLDTVLLNITVTDSSPRQARDIANQVATEFPLLVDDIETPPGRTASPVKVSVTRNATLPSAPVTPRKKLNLALGLIVGLAIGFGAGILRNSLDRTVHSKYVAAECAGAPVLGALPDEPKLTHQLIIDEQATPRAEAFRQLRTSIRFLSVDRRLNSLVVTGSLPEEGKTTTAANLAITLAQAGQPVVLVDADLRKPNLANVFALSNGVGLTNVLLGDVPVNGALQHWRPDLPLYVLTAGPQPPNPSELLGSARLKRMVDSLQASGMTVIFDSPPLLPVTDAAVIAQVTGGALVVTRVGRTRTDQLAAAVSTLRTVGATVLGVVGNREKKKRKEAAYSTYYRVPSPRSQAHSPHRSQTNR